MTRMVTARTLQASSRVMPPHRTGPSYTRTFRGLAPQAQIVNLRVLDSNGQGVDSAVINAIDRAIELKATYNIRVLNLSLGPDDPRKLHFGSSLPSCPRSMASRNRGCRSSRQQRA